MELFWGGGPPKAPPSHAPSVPVLLERLRNARAQADRREIVQDLKVTVARVG